MPRRRTLVFRTLVSTLVSTARFRQPADKAGILQTLQLSIRITSGDFCPGVGLLTEVSRARTIRRILIAYTVSWVKP